MTVTASSKRPRLSVVPSPAEPQPDLERDDPDLGVDEQSVAVEVVGNSDRNSDDTPAEEVDPTRVTRVRARARADRSKRVWAKVWPWLRSCVASAATLPDVVRNDQPSLVKLFNYARWGEQHPPEGALRVVSIVAYVALTPFQVVFRLCEWIFQRPMRALAVCSLIWVLRHVPAVDAVLDLLGHLVTWPLT